MATLNISLPQSLKDYAQNKSKTDEYSNQSHYIVSLIQEDKKRQSIQIKIETMLIEGLESGEPISVTSDYWSSKKERLADELIKK